MVGDSIGFLPLRMVPARIVTTIYKKRGATGILILLASSGRVVLAPQRERKEEDKYNAPQVSMASNKN